MLSNVDDLAVNQRHLRVRLHKTHDFKHFRVQIVLLLTTIVPLMRLPAFLLKVLVDHLSELIRHHFESRRDQLLHLELAIACLAIGSWRLDPAD